MRRKNLLWLFCEGPFKKKFVQLTKNIPNIIFIPLQEEEKFNELLNAADISIIPQKENTEDLFLPSKLISILASGTPVVANVKTNSDLGKLVNEAGIRVDPNDQAGFINAINHLKDNHQLRNRLGKKGRMIAEKMFNKNIVLNNFNDFIENNFNQNICKKDFSN